MNFAIITLDSLRWDASQLATTPNLSRLFESHNEKWHKVYAQGTYTLTAHVSMFHDGHLPCNDLDKGTPQMFRRQDKFCIFKPDLNWVKRKKIKYPTPPKAENIVKGFAQMGYRTVGVGGVHWFNSNYPASDIWSKYYFNEFYWKPEFGEEFKESFENQIELIKTLRLRKTKKLFFFLNVASTHRPCRGNKSIRGQADALDYIDSHIMKVLNLLPRPTHLFLMSDHGTLFGEDGLHHHGFYHPKVMEIPMVSLMLE